jgi:hypothetical protein
MDSDLNVKRRALESTSMPLPVTGGTKCNQVVQGIVAEFASFSQMMYV